MSSNAQGFAAIDEMVRRLRGLPAAFRAELPALAPEVKRICDAALDHGTSIDGKPFAPRKDGGRPLANAKKAISVYVNGDFIIIELTGVEVWHHFGTKHVPPRPILPTGDGMPPTFGEALKAGMVRVYEREVGRG